MTNSGRISTTRKSTGRTASDRSRQTYVDGSTVRKLQTVQAPERIRREIEKQRPARRTAGQVQEQPQLSIRHTIFLAAAAALTLWVCVGYLQLQADYTGRMKNITTLENQLAELKNENDDEYNRVTTSVDLEYIRDVAINELGMVYASADQVVLYDSQNSDFVKQYSEIPEASDSSLEGIILGSR